MDTKGLAALLNRAAVLPGRIDAAGIEVIETGAFNSSTVRLRVRTPESAAPVALVLKRPTDVAWSIAAAATEARFYRLVVETADHPPVVPRCLAVGPADDPYVLLEDLSATHRPPTSRELIIAATGLPDPVDQRAVIDCLARLQAYWWEHPAQDGGVLERGFWSADGEGFASFARRRRSAWRAVLRDHGAWLPPEVVERCQQVCDGLSTYGERWLLPRVEGHRQLTLLHGDAYFSNFLCPIDGVGPATLLDWQSACFDLGAFDLVNLIATFWTREQRRDQDRESRLLADFHARLVDHGVTGYPREALIEDYRLGLVYWLLVPLQDAHDGSRRDYWWPKLQCLIAAFDDWDCDQLLR